MHPLDKHIGLLLQVQKYPLVMAGNDLPLGDALEMLQPLRAPEPGGVVTCQPALRDPIAPLQPSQQIS